MQAVLGYAEHVDMPLCGNRGKVAPEWVTDEEKPACAVLWAISPTRERGSPLPEGALC